MKIRPIMAVVAGCVVWAVVFPVLAYVEARFWPDLAKAARAYFETDTYLVFSTAMLASFQVLWPITNATAGLVTGLIAKRRTEVSVLGVILVLYFAYNHLWVLWEDLPIWYNVVVVLLVVPMVLAGGAIASVMRRRRAAGDTVVAS